MGGLEIVPVATPAQLDRFIALPARLQAGDPNFVPPLRLERREALSPRKNPYFEHGEAQFWLACREGRDVGRISLANKDAIMLRVAATLRNFNVSVVNRTVE